MGLKKFLSGGVTRATVLARILAGVDTLERVQEIREGFRRAAVNGEPYVIAFTAEEVRRIVTKL